MKKLSILLILVTLTFTLVACSNSTKNESPGQTDSKAKSSNKFEVVNACDILTEQIAKDVLGENAKKGDSDSETSTEDLSVTSCSYTAMIDPNALGADNIEIASVLVRSPKTTVGAKSNEAMFGDQKPSGVTDVKDMGDKAYFNAQLGQLNILQNSNWYIVSNYRGIPSNATLEHTSKFANQLTFR